MTNQALPFKISLSKKQAEIIDAMQKGYVLEWHQGTRMDEWWYTLRNDNRDSPSSRHISSRTITTLEQKGMIVIDKNRSNWQTRAWMLTERGKTCQIKE